jgi:hypothetical protein
VNKRLPPDAFGYYVALGPARSHQAVADKYDVHKRTVVRTADRENWTDRLATVEQEARDTADKHLAKDLAEQTLRHRKMLTAMASRAARALQEFPLTSGMEGIKAAAVVIKLERLLSGEPTERTSVDLEQLVRREYQQLMTVEDEDDDEGEVELDDET